MRVTGDPDGCRAAARSLRRAAAVAATAAEEQRRTAWLPQWSGTSARLRHDLALRRAGFGSSEHDRLAAVASVLDRHAAELDELQRRARRLTAAAEREGLHLDDDGRVPPLALGPAVDAAGRARAERLQQVRAGLQRAAAELLHDVGALHARTAAALPAVRRERCPTGTAAGPSALPGPGWGPTPWDAPAAGLAGGQAAASVGLVRSPLLTALLAGTRAAPLVGSAVGVAVDTAQGMSLAEAVAKNVLVGAAGTAVAAGAVLTAPVTVPAAAVGVAAVGLGAAVTYGAGRAWDALAPFPRQAGQQRAPGSAPAPRPGPGPAPRPPAASRPQPSRPSTDRTTTAP